MNAATKRIISSFVLLVIFGLALFLRLYGIDWAFKDGAYTAHPDENHYGRCAGEMRPQWLTEEENNLPLKDKLNRLYEKNLKVPPGKYTPGNPGLRPINYNYGTFPLHLYLLYRQYLIGHSGEAGTWNFLAFPDWLSILGLVFAILIGIRLFIAANREYRNSTIKPLPLWQDERRLTLLFPCLVIPITGLILAVSLPQVIVNLEPYNPKTASIILIGRIVTAWAGAFTVLLAYLIGRDAYNRTTGLIAACMLATAMLHVQTSHFATVDVLTGFWSTAAVYCFLKVAKKSGLIWYLLGAVCIGFTVGSKWSGVTLPGILFLAHAIATWGDERHGKTGRWINTVWLFLSGLFLLHFFKSARSTKKLLNVSFAEFRDFYINHFLSIVIIIAFLFTASIVLLIVRRIWNGRQVGWFLPAVRIYRPWLWLSIAIPAGLAAFLFAQPMAYFDAQVFSENIAEQVGINATGTRPVVYTQQFNNTTPVFHSLDNLFYPSLDYLTAFFVVAGCLYALARVFVRRDSSDLLLSAWVIPSFLLYSTFSSKFPRYMVAILPVMTVLGGRFIVDLIRIQPTVFTPSFPRLGVGWKQAARRSGIIGGGLALLCGLIYGYAYIRIYDQPHTLVQAGRIVRENMRPGTKITQNSWDEGIGVHVEWDDMLHIHDSAGEAFNPNRAKERVNYFAKQLNRVDYIVFPSKRAYGSTLRNPDKFPVTNQFLRALFTERLGFRIAKVIANPPNFLSLEFRVDEEDETARIYDHPKVIIFEKTEKFSVAQLEDLILNPPAWVDRITDEEILTLKDGYPVYADPPSHPVLSWWLILMLLGFIGFILIFPLCGRLPDGGYGISKVVGIALFSWLSWFCASTGVLPLSRYQALFVLLVLTAAAVWTGYRHKEAIRDFMAEKWLLLAGTEILFIVIWAVFLLIRSYHPAAYDGEKYMNVSFINAVYRADTFPPEDPWIAGYPINYYYYGHALFALVGRAIALPPEYLFNLAGTCTAALTGIGIFSLVYALCRRIAVSLLAVYLALFAGHLISYFNLVKHELHKTGMGLWYCLSGIYPVFKLTCLSVLNYLGLASEEASAQLSALNWHQIFWPSGHDIFFGTVANEFPYWMHLFMDFHAHMLVIPFVFAFLTLLYAYFAKSRAETGPVLSGGFIFFLALLLGTVICTNTWDFPALLIAFILAIAIKFHRESEFLNGRMTRVHWLSVETLQSLLRFPLLPLVCVLVFSYLFLLPFHANFTSRVTGIGWMSEGNSPLSTYLGFWAHLLVPLIFSVTLLAIMRGDGKISFLRTSLFGILFCCSLALALGVSQYIRSALIQNPGRFGGFFTMPIPEPNGFIPPMTDYAVAGLFLPFLVVLFLSLWKRDRDASFIYACLIGLLGLGLSLGIEFFYIKEGWARPRHRWNTVFKFNIQIWHYLSIFAALSFLYVWRWIRDLGANLGRIYRTAGHTIFVLCTVPLLLATVPFAVIAPVLETMTHTAISKDAIGEIPSLDAFAWLRKDHPADYRAIKWFDRFVPGTPHIVETAYNHYYQWSRFSSNTGLPALIGWVHHVGERLHEQEKVPRRHAVQRIYLSPDKEEVLNLLGRYDIEYLVFGELEMSHPRGERNELPPFGKKSLERFEQWGDIFRLVFRSGDTSVFKIDKSLNRVYGILTEPEVMKPERKIAPADRPPETGNSMFAGGRGSENGMFAEPRGIAQGPEGYFYIADTQNHRIQVFKPDGEYAWQAGEEGDQNGQFKEPNDIAIDPKTGNIFITDTWNHRIVLLDKKGVFQGATPLGFFGPRGIVYHPQWSLLYVADTGNHQIKAVTLSGELIQTWGNPGGGTDEESFREPVGIEITPGGNAIVLDSLNRRIKVYSAQGERIGLWPIQTDWQGDGGYEGHLACSPDGNIYLTDMKEQSVHIYSPEGELLDKITQDVTGQLLVQPIGICFAEDGRILVSDMALSRILQIR